MTTLRLAIVGAGPAGIYAADILQKMERQFDLSIDLFDKLPAPYGLVRGGGLDRNAELIVRRDLGILPPEELERRCRSLGAEILPSNADFCARFDFAPRYPVWLKVWFADEEFPASGRLLLDESAPHYLTIEDAVTVGSLILDQLTGAQHWAV